MGRSDGLSRRWPQGEIGCGFRSRSGETQGSGCSKANQHQFASGYACLVMKTPNSIARRGLILVYRQIISSINTRTKQEHGTLMSKIAEQRATLHQVHDSIECVESKMEGVDSSCRAVLSKVEETQISVMSLRSLGEQITAFIRTFPHDMRDLLQSIMQVD